MVRAASGFLILVDSSRIHADVPSLEEQLHSLFLSLHGFVVSENDPSRAVEDIEVSATVVGQHAGYQLRVSRKFSLPVVKEPFLDNDQGGIQLPM